MRTEAFELSVTLHITAGADLFQLQNGLQSGRYAALQLFGPECTMVAAALELLRLQVALVASKRDAP